MRASYTRAELRWVSRRAQRGALCWGLVLAFGGLLPFCSSDDSSTCESGRQVECACPGAAKGVQICIDDGSGYGACVCGDGSAGSAGSSGSSGSSGSGGSSASGGTSGASGSSGTAGTTSDAGPCPPDSVTDVTAGSCDVVDQNCAAGETCTLEKSDAGSWQTACAEYGNGTKELGSVCGAHQECGGGLRCTLGKCTRPCCPEREDELCGSEGKCDLEISFEMGAARLTVCTFSPPCTPWANDCPPGPESDCHIGLGNEFSCSFVSYNPDAGSTLGQPCTFLNDCGDSQHCITTSADASTGTCRWLCKVSNTGAPDSGTIGGAPGQGGCESGETCRAFSSPSWLGICAP